MHIWIITEYIITAKKAMAPVAEQPAGFHGVHVCQSLELAGMDRAREMRQLL